MCAMSTPKEVFAEVYTRFESPVSRYDCGRKCAPHNGGTPVCCSTEHAVPIVDVTEWELLRSRSDLWRPYVATDAEGRKIVADLHPDSCAVECKGAAFCERDNRSIACRAFPFAPYLTRRREFIGLTVYWEFEDRCWVINNLQVVDLVFLRECFAAYETIFGYDREELQTFLDYSATMRRVFTRAGRRIPLLDRDGGLFAVEPRTHLIRPAVLAEFPRFGPYKGEAPAPADPDRTALAAD
jgi:hypothetical protein